MFCEQQQDPLHHLVSIQIVLADNKDEAPHQRIKKMRAAYLKASLSGIGDLTTITLTCSPTSNTSDTWLIRPSAMLLMCIIPLHTMGQCMSKIACIRNFFG